MNGVRAADVLPRDADLPGGGWLAIDEGFAGGRGGDGPGALFDCVGSRFPEDAVVASAASPHFLRPPASLVHGLSAEFETEQDAGVAHEILRSSAFAECLGRSIAADVQSDVTDAELLAVDLAETAHGHRVRFTGGDRRGVRPVNLAVVTLRIRTVVGVLWCGDTPADFPVDDLDHLIARIRARSMPD